MGINLEKLYVDIGAERDKPKSQHVHSPHNYPHISLGSDENLFNNQDLFSSLS